eukprot:CAMPEP_0172515682 /NCGR_PEP_ID=MMETSP1066-20121228/269807_1 /TAXON_ID=671091 /ORGANISM="Coscinodiscus wailesii, Strain CCMP2513" /LENGTH=181 /DNA_ID=CAMNT_0013296821 /DNA_START=193 /DNA_END=734 /DNA_ORIENTATION=+
MMPISANGLAAILFYVLILANTFNIHNRVSRQYSGGISGNQARRIVDLERQLTSQKKQTNALQQQLDALFHHHPTRRINNATYDLTSPESICHKIINFPGNLTPTTSSLWSQYLSPIANAAQHPRDSENDFHDFTALLLHLLTPTRLSRSVKTLPKRSDVRHLLQKLLARYRHLKNNGPPA